ncbi:MAG: inositol monophosphatase [Actinomycetota bacterium]|nr:inositol monophosphatase [Actinomycetota bacterium]
MADPHDLLPVAVEAARAAGALLLEGRQQAADQSGAETKTSGTDMVTDMDRASEALLARTLLDARPGDAFLGEEGTAGVGTTGVRWVVDPLDGTTNYLYGFPAWAVSVAGEVDGQVAVGVVYDPSHDEMFTAVRGGGARCNQRPLHVEGPAELETALLATGFSYDPASRGLQAAELAQLLPSVRDVRRAGAAALDLCWVALGRVDLYFERGIQPWDWAAGSLVATEAGAVVTDLGEGTVVAAPPQLHGSFLSLLEAARARVRAEQSGKH